MRDWRAELRGRLATLRLQPGDEAEIVEELAEHAEQEYLDLSGRVGAAEAERIVGERLADDSVLRVAAMRVPSHGSHSAEPPGVDRSSWFADAASDLRYSVRAFRLS